MTALRFSLRRFLSLLKKEALEVLRDPSTLFMGVGLPLLMLFIYGYGVSMNMESIPAAVVLKERTPAALAYARDLAASPHFDVRTAAGRPEAEGWFEDRSVELILEIPDGFERDLQSGRAELSLTVYGVDSNSALIFRNYASGVIAKTTQKLLSEGRIPAEAAASASGLPAVAITSRTWFNDEVNSRWYLVPGLLVIVSAVSASLMGSIVVAREWERGTLTSLFATPASALEILAAKWSACVAVAFLGFALCLVLAFLLFNEPLYGSLWALIGTGILLIGWAAAVGLFVSAKTRSQFLATEAAVLATFLPTMMLSGFIFDLRSVPAWIEAVGRLLPPTYAVESFRICFLSGGEPLKLLFNAFVIFLWTALLFSGALKVLGKSPKRPKLWKRPKAKKPEEPANASREAAP